jgi:hypothetical protein
MANHRQRKRFQRPKAHVLANKHNERLETHYMRLEQQYKRSAKSRWDRVFSGVYGGKAGKLGRMTHKTGGVGQIDLSHFKISRRGIQSTIVRRVQVMHKKGGKITWLLDTREAWEKAFDGLLFNAASVLLDREYKDRRREATEYVNGQRVRVEMRDELRMTRLDATRLFMCVADRHGPAKLNYDKLDIGAILAKYVRGAELTAQR